VRALTPLSSARQCWRFRAATSARLRFLPDVDPWGRTARVMFEGTPPLPPYRGPLSEEGTTGTLRELTWAALVSRLAASRDLRRAYRNHAQHAEGSFDPTCARRIASQHNGNRSVNLDDLSDGNESATTGMDIMPGAI